MKSKLISINPPHTNNIFEKVKGIEWRTKPIPMGKCYCYETKKCFGIGKVIGEFKVCRVERYEDVNLIPEEIINLGCVPIEFLEAYSKGRPLYANFIKDAQRYDNPKELSEFVVERYPCLTRLKRPPQSWCYIDHIAEEGGEG